jgi:hypothetical protein
MRRNEKGQIVKTVDDMLRTDAVGSPMMVSHICSYEGCRLEERFPVAATPAHGDWLFVPGAMGEAMAVLDVRHFVAAEVSEAIDMSGSSWDDTGVQRAGRPTYTLQIHMDDVTSPATLFLRYPCRCSAVRALCRLQTHLVALASVPGSRACREGAADVDALCKQMVNK